MPDNCVPIGGPFRAENRCTPNGTPIALDHRVKCGENTFPSTKSDHFYEAWESSADLQSCGVERFHHLPFLLRRPVELLSKFS